MARPAMQQGEKRNRYVVFRVTEKEFQQLQELTRTSGKSSGVVIREKMFKGRFPRPKTPKLDLYTYAELKKIGVNLNQLTRKVNAGVLPKGLQEQLSQLRRQQEMIIARLLDDRHTENR